LFEIPHVVELILARRAAVAAERSVLVGISGIDGSGKGFITAQLTAQLVDLGFRVANINIDGWLNLPSRRFSTVDPARHFYEHGLRLSEMFAQLVLPLKAGRSHRLEADLADATNAERYHRHMYEYANIDIILLEGIFLFKPAYRDSFDLTCWIACRFETALTRALARGQEGLPLEETIRAYETIYFPAQRLHLEQDDPLSFATAVVNNDSQP
jgi:uridine kinase